MLFVCLLPLLTILIFNLTIGRTPTTLDIGVVDDEIPSHCSYQPFDICDDRIPLSCKFMKEMEKHDLTLVTYALRLLRARCRQINKRENVKTRTIVTRLVVTLTLSRDKTIVFRGNTRISSDAPKTYERNRHQQRQTLNVKIISKK